MAVGLGLRHRLVGTQQVEDEMTAKRMTPEQRAEIEATLRMTFPDVRLMDVKQAAYDLLDELVAVEAENTALLDRLDEAEREFRQSHANNCTPDYTERGLHSSLCRLYMVGPE